ncbi:hypothetical protein GCM10010313_63210 [Streptomyces violarus]|nr:hypothetical protein GCM10010313_63210 [Streptomyces violarus]
MGSVLAWAVAVEAVAVEAVAASKAANAVMRPRATEVSRVMALASTRRRPRRGRDAQFRKAVADF